MADIVHDVFVTESPGSTIWTGTHIKSKGI